MCFIGLRERAEGGDDREPALEWRSGERVTSVLVSGRSQSKVTVQLGKKSSLM